MGDSGGGGGRSGRGGSKGGSGSGDAGQPGEVFRAAELSAAEQRIYDSERSYKNANKPIPEDHRAGLIRSLEGTHRLYDRGETFGASKSDITAIKSTQNKIVNHPDLTMGQAKTIRRAITNPAVVKKLAKELKI